MDEEKVKEWRELVDEVVSIASNHPEHLQAVIVEQLLQQMLSPQRVKPATEEPASAPRERDGSDSPNDESTRRAPIGSGLRAVVEDADVTLAELERVVELDENAIRVFGELEAEGKKGRMIDLSVIGCYLNEKARGQKTTQAATLRELCERDGCLDHNFSTYLKETAYLLVEGMPGSKAKNYRLSKPGVEWARELLQQMVG